ncbi:hypothetical protein MOSE0_H01178 [Monosporozyma servazzii]
MQGGIRRKKDLLPRYKKNRSIHNRNGSILTTPMKKILVYLGLLFIVFLVLRVAYSDLNKVPQYELDHSNAFDDENNDDDDDGVFDEISNDIKQNSHSNDKIIIEDNQNKIDAKDNDIDTDGRKKVSKDKFNNEVAMQQETKNLENDLKPKVDAKDIPKKAAIAPDAHAAPPAAAPVPPAPPALDAAAGALAVAAGGAPVDAAAQKKDVI